MLDWTLISCTQGSAVRRNFQPREEEGGEYPLRLRRQAADLLQPNVKVLEELHQARLQLSRLLLAQCQRASAQGGREGERGLGWQMKADLAIGDRVSAEDAGLVAGQVPGESTHNVHHYPMVVHQRVIGCCRDGSSKKSGGGGQDGDSRMEDESVFNKAPQSRTEEVNSLDQGIMLFLLLYFIEALGANPFGHCRHSISNEWMNANEREDSAERRRYRARR